MSTRSVSPPQSRLTLVAGLSFAVLLGLALRMAAAQGGIWTDEAWSVLYARDAGGPWGVISSINHDNNHHINSWWLQFVGADASSLAMRALSVATSTMTILVAGLIGLRRGVATAIVTALLFALSPILVLYGSEARGYAPMLLCFLLMIWTVLRWTEREEAPFPSLLLALFALIGAFSHLLMLPGVAIIGLWVLILFAEQQGWRGAIPHAVPAMAPAVIAVLSVLVLVIVMAARSPLGMRVGGYTPFSWNLYAIGLGDLAGLLTGFGSTFGSPLLAAGLAAAVMSLALAFPAPAPRNWSVLIAALCLLIPTAVVILHPGNSQFARYHLPCVIGVLFFLGHWIGAHLESRSWTTFLALIVLAVLLIGNIQKNQALIANQRGQSDLPIQLISAAAPKGAEVRITMERARAILDVAAERQNYPVKITLADCGPQPFLLIDRTGEGPAKPRIRQCDETYNALASADANSASGQSWTLYAKAPLPSPKPAVNSAPPSR